MAIEQRSRLNKLQLLTLYLLSRGPGLEAATKGPGACESRPSRSGYYSRMHMTHAMLAQPYTRFAFPTTKASTFNQS